MTFEGWGLIITLRLGSRCTLIRHCMRVRVLRLWIWNAGRQLTHNQSCGCGVPSPSLRGSTESKAARDPLGSAVSRSELTECCSPWLCCSPEEGGHHQIDYRNYTWHTAIYTACAPANFETRGGVIDSDVENSSDMSYRSEVWKRKIISSKLKPSRMTQKMDEPEWGHDELNYSGI